MVFQVVNNFIVAQNQKINVFVQESCNERE